MRRIALLLLATAGCVAAPSKPQRRLPDAGFPVDAGASDGGVTIPSYFIQTGATLTYTPGVDAGFYIAYAAGGHWRLDWACDTMVSGAGCDFAGHLYPDSGSLYNGVANDCESGTMSCASYLITFSASEIDFDRTLVQPDAYSYLTWDTDPGAPVRFDLTLDGVDHPELVFYPVPGAPANPAAIPFDLTPDSP